MNSSKINNFKNLSSGVILILIPLLMVFGFVSHPNFFDLSNPWDQGVELFVKEFHGNTLWWHAHLAVLFVAPLMIVLISALSSLVSKKDEFIAFSGSVLGVFGATMLAADKGIWALAMSAIEALPEDQFQEAMPVINQLFLKEGYVWLADLFYLMICGITILAIGLIKTKVVPMWQGISILVGSFLFYNPDIDLLYFVGSVFLLIGLFPIGVLYIKGEYRLNKHGKVQ